MSLSDSTAALVTALNKLPAVLQKQFTPKVAKTALADSTLEVAGLLPADLGTALDAELTAHTQTDGHTHLKLTDLAIPAYLDVANMIGTRVPLANLPVSRYGELSYLPPGVSGSFQGASGFFGTYQEGRAFPGIVEDNGTFVYLRNGTTGGPKGVYYAYVKNITGTFTGPIRTNKAYQPAYFPGGYTAGYVTRGDLSGGCIMGRLQDSTGALGAWFLSLTNGTFDDSKHVGCTFAANTIPLLSNAYPEVFLGNNAVFIMQAAYDLSGGGGVNPFEFQVWTIPLSAIQAGGTVTPTKLTGWTCTGGFGNGNQIAGTTNMQFASKLYSTSAADYPFLVQDASAQVAGIGISCAYGNQLGMQTYSAQRADGVIRTRIMTEVVLSYNNTGEQIVWNGQFSLIWNPTALQCYIEAPYNSASNHLALVNNKLSLTGPSVILDVSQYSTGNWFTGQTLTWHPQGYWIGVLDQAIVDQVCYIARGQMVSAGISKFDALYAGSTTQNRASVGFLPAYGSAVGGTLAGCFQLPNSRMMVYGTGRKVNGSIVKGLVLAQRGASGYSYKSFYQGTLSGYAPNAYRQFVTDIGLNQSLYQTMISEISNAGAVVASGNMGIENITNTGFVNCDSNGVLTGSTSIAPALYASIKAAVLSAVGYSSSTLSRCTIVVPQNTAVPPFALVSFRDTTANVNECLACAELSITAGSRTGAITGMSVLSVSSLASLWPFMVSFTDNQADYTFMGGSITIYEGTDCYMVGGLTKHFVSRSNFTGLETFRFAIPKSNLRPDWTTLSAVSCWGFFETLYPTAMPGVGFGLNYQSNNQSDGATKLTFVPVATTLAQYKAWAIPANTSWLVQVSQDVAAGFIVYFTDVTPLVLSGVAYQLQPATFDLSTIQANPANTTFYCYVQVNAGVASYLISLTQIAESASVMYLGTIVTGATTITSLNLNKVTRIGNYRLSKTAAGSAITVSNGTPNASSTAAWT